MWPLCRGVECCPLYCIAKRLFRITEVASSKLSPSVLRAGTWSRGGVGSSNCASCSGFAGVGAVLTCSMVAIVVALNRRTGRRLHREKQTEQSEQLRFACFTLSMCPLIKATGVLSNVAVVVQFFLNLANLTVVLQCGQAAENHFGVCCKGVCLCALRTPCRRPHVPRLVSLDVHAFGWKLTCHRPSEAACSPKVATSRPSGHPSSVACTWSVSFIPGGSCAARKPFQNTNVSRRRLRLAECVHLTILGASITRLAAGRQGVQGHCSSSFQSRVCPLTLWSSSADCMCSARVHAR